MLSQNDKAKVDWKLRNIEQEIIDKLMHGEDVFNSSYYSGQLDLILRLKGELLN